jgi:DNA polymerase
MKPILNPNHNILFVGDIPSDSDLKHNLPFMGASGELLSQILEMAGISRNNVSLTNVFHEKPNNNNLDSWGISLKEFRKLLPAISPEFSVPIHGPKLVVHPDKSVQALIRLKQEILTVQPNVIVALGGVALNALTGISEIGKVRGSLYISTLVPKLKVIPTYHPTAIFKQFDNLPIAVLDIRKAIIESATPNINFVSRNLHITQTVDDVITVKTVMQNAEIITFDIETKARQITCVGLCAEPTNIYVIPFWSIAAPGYSYWSEKDEIIVYKLLRDIFQSPIPKVAQNGLYDIQYLAAYGIRVDNYTHDTMLLHHAMFPSLPKGLDFLGSLYANERAWKKFRPRKGGVSQKKDE